MESISNKMLKRSDFERNACTISPYLFPLLSAGITTDYIIPFLRKKLEKLPCHGWNGSFLDYKPAKIVLDSQKPKLEIPLVLPTLTHQSLRSRLLSPILGPLFKRCILAKK